MPDLVGGDLENSAKTTGNNPQLKIKTRRALRRTQVSNRSRQCTKSASLESMPVARLFFAIIEESLRRLSRKLHPWCLCQLDYRRQSIQHSRSCAWRGG